MGRKVDLEQLEKAASLILEAVGEDPLRDGLRGTPERFARMWRDFIEYDPGKCDTTFEAESVDEMVVVRPIRTWTLCEHHLLPFRCDLTIAYIPNGNILGLSKFARIAQKHAHKLQVQERLVEDVSREVTRVTGSSDVAVFAKGYHLCMAMRGVRSDAKMVCSKLHGAFKNDPATRAEFMRMVRR